MIIKLPQLPDWFKPRPWQDNCFQGYVASVIANKRDFLIASVPASGKTIMGIWLAHYLIEEERVNKLIVICHTDGLKAQWRTELMNMGLKTTSDIKIERGKVKFPNDCIGIVTTYQQISWGSNSDKFRAFCQEHDVVAILDEPHHMADTEENFSTWSPAIKNALLAAKWRIHESGTPFRSDGQEIPFLTYDEDDIVVTDFSYSYRDALYDGGVVRPAIFPTYEGEMEWMSGDQIYNASFSDNIPREELSNRLKTALNTKEGGWLYSVIKDADKQLDKLRTTTHSNAGGLVTATDHEHAITIAEMIEGVTGEYPVLVTHKIRKSSDKIKTFRGGKQKWLVSVKMVTEGVDIPRLRVGIFATNIMTLVFFLQFLGRFIRWDKLLDDDIQYSYIYVPKSGDLVRWMKIIEEAVQAWQKLIGSGEKRPSGNGSGGNGQRRIFAPIDADAEIDGYYSHGKFYSPAEIEEARKLKDDIMSIRNSGIDPIDIAELFRRNGSPLVGNSPRDKQTNGKEEFPLVPPEPKDPDETRKELGGSLKTLVAALYYQVVDCAKYMPLDLLENMVSIHYANDFIEWSNSLDDPKIHISEGCRAIHYKFKKNWKIKYGDPGPRPTEQFYNDKIEWVNKQFGLLASIA